jgi:hypothetical protein
MLQSKNNGISAKPLLKVSMDVSPKINEPENETDAKNQLCAMETSNHLACAKP